MSDESTALIVDLLRNSEEDKGVPQIKGVIDDDDRVSDTLTQAERKKIEQIIDIINKKNDVNKDLLGVFKLFFRELKNTLSSLYTKDSPSANDIPKPKVTPPSAVTTAINAPKNNIPIQSDPSAITTAINAPKNNIPIQSDPSTLTSNEVQRYTQLFTIMGKVLGIGKFAEGPEADILKSPSTVDKPKAINTITSPVLAKPDKPQGSFWMDLFEKVGLGALLYDLMTGNFSGILTAMYNTVKTVLQRVWNSISGGVTKIFSNLKQGIIKRFESFKQTDLFKSFKDILDNIITNVKEKIDEALKYVKDLPSKIISGAKKLVPDILPTPIQAAKDAVKPIASAIGRTGTAIGAKINAGKDFIKRNVVSKASAAIKTVLEESGGTVGLLKRAGKTLKPFAKIPVVGSFLEILFGKGDIENLKQQRVANEIKTDQELYNKAGRRVLEGLSGVIGGAGGAALGSFLGGPLGTLLGGLIGDLGGRFASKFAAEFIPPSALETAGKAVVTGIEPEMQDFVIKNGKVYRINSKDELLGMKDGGAVSSLLESMNTTNNKQFNFAIKQIQVLEEIREGIRKLTEIRSGNSTTSSTSVGISNNAKDRPSFKPYNIRDQFNNMYNPSQLTPSLL